MRYLLSTTLVVVGMVNVADASTLTLASGNLSAGNPWDTSPNVTILSAGATGTFSATKSVTDNVYELDGQGHLEIVSTATATAQITSDSLTVSAISDGSTYPQYPSGQQLHSITSAQGSLTFALDALTNFSYSANSRWNSVETITDAHGVTVLSVGCPDIANTCLNGQTFDGSVLLAQGVYTLSFNDTAVQMAGTTIDSNMSFSLQPVPLPAGIWLLGSALLGIRLTVRRRG